ncbi:hypothetical protein D9619_008138 [Psilocybe cf. subviscida]|uniref:Transmembrane protein n=1 Tax=Psilocybe cf. subviscida TaxID=2480587 RepID=A0A8H5AU04_9AGAR|nr:hypothetical protein D9619_008138 [Psilocybe cf. subviscida]
MSTLPVIVDDQDVTEYTGHWDHQVRATQEYKGSVSTYPAPGFESGFLGTPSLSISFDGSDIVFYGTLRTDLVANYIIDGGPSRPMKLSGNDTGLVGAEIWRLSLNSIDTFHSLTIFPVAGVFIFDYYTYTPTPGEMEEFSRNLIMDDQNPMITYSSGWTHNTNVEYPTGVPYLHSTTGTNITGSTMQITFPGFSISVYGTLQQVNGSLPVSFSVDNAAPTSRTLTARCHRRSPGQNDHTLLVTLQNVTGAQALWIDYLILDDTTGLTSVGGITPPPDAPSFTPASPGSRLSGRALAGIVVAVIVIVFALVVGGLRRCRQLCRRKPSATQENPPPPPEPKPPTPVPAAPEVEPPEKQIPPASTPNLQDALSGFLVPHHIDTHWDTSTVASVENTVSQPTFSSTDIPHPPEKGINQHQETRCAHLLPASPVNMSEIEPRTFVVGEGFANLPGDAERTTSTSSLAHPAHNPTDEGGRTPVRAGRARTVRPLPPVPSGPYGRQ